MSHEGTPNGNENKSERGPRTAAGAFRAAEHREALERDMERWTEKYREIQMRIAGLERDVQTGIEHMQTLTNPKMIELSKEIGKKTLQDLEDAKVEKEEIEEAIRERGGEPHDYTVQ